MSLMELFSNYTPQTKHIEPEAAKGNSGNSPVTATVTSLAHATYSGNSGNSGNNENIVTEVKNVLIKCGGCLHFKCHNPHRQGAGICNASGAYGLWSETPHQCGKFDAAVEWVYSEEPQGKTVKCYTPNGKPIEVKATSSEHAAWLLKMNPKRVMP